MNVIKVIRTAIQPVRLVRVEGQPVRLVRPTSNPIRLENTGGVVILGGAADAAHLPINTNLKIYYQLQKQV